MKNFKDTQEAELKSWFSDNPKVNKDKRIRETIRYPLLKKQMGLNALDMSGMYVGDLGSGPFGGVSSIIKCREVERIDPLINEYAKYYPQYNGIAIKAEDMTTTLSKYDLIIITNALDHFEDPEEVLWNLVKFMKPGAFYAHIHAIDNAYSHPHEAHAKNVNPEMFHEILDKDFETVWYMDFLNDGLIYGWRGQEAFSGLYRKSTGYDK